jgi:mitogen-activated protein kinase kinase kinase 11
MQGAVLRRARDVALGLAHLHAQNICHGDLKCENVLLRSDTSDPEGVTAKVADFGLSRALAVGQSHLSTRRYGTVTHMPPELLSSGKLTVAADVYSFGIMSESWSW